MSITCVRNVQYQVAFSSCLVGLSVTCRLFFWFPQQRIDGYFGRINDIIKRGKIPARIKFMLQDVQELRRNEWIPRLSQTSGLKTIDQVHSCQYMYETSVVLPYLYIMYMYMYPVPVRQVYHVHVMSLCVYTCTSFTGVEQILCQILIFYSFCNTSAPT